MRKIFGIPLVFLLILGAASAAIIGVGIYTIIDVWGTYQNDDQARGFTVQDGDLTDSITFQPNEIDPNKYYISFPLYRNQAQVDYKDVLRIVPDGTVTSLRFSDIQRTNNGITSAWLTFREIGNTTEPATEITTSPTSVCFAAKGNHNYSVNFKITTGNANASTENIQFKISKCED
jgi:hypothetical protein